MLGVRSLNKKSLNVDQQENDEQEQYIRRNCLRITGIPQKQDECTDTIVLNIAKKINIDLKLEDMDRSHRLGPKAVKDIVVKFTSYCARRALISKRSALKNCHEVESRRVFINKDLMATGTDCFSKRDNWSRPRS